MLLTNLSLKAEAAVCSAILVLLFALSIGVVLVTHGEGDSEYHDISHPDVLGLSDSGDTAWVLASSALVMFMTPGVAFFYGGLVPQHSTLTTMMLSFMTVGVVACLWVIVGFSLAFGPSLHGIIGNPAHFALFRRVGPRPYAKLADHIPLNLYAIYQMSFAIITPSLTTGSFVERVRLSAYVWFVVFWHIIVYCPLAHVTWHPDGLLRKFKIMDYAGGMVVHMASGIAALTVSVYLGARRDQSAQPSASIPDAVIGTSILWFGWSGFNAGSALKANSQASHAFVTTQLGAAAGLVSWLIMERLDGLKFRITGACCGLILGLVAVTPGAGYMSVGAAMCSGMISSVVAGICMKLIHRYTKLDDALDCFAVHGVGGSVGMVCVAMFASRRINSAGENGLFHGGVDVFWHTIVALPVCFAFIILGTLLCLVLADCMVTLRVPPEMEEMGMDVVGMREEVAPASRLFQRLREGESAEGSEVEAQDRHIAMLMKRGIPREKISKDELTGEVKFKTASGVTFRICPGLTRQAGVVQAQ